MIQPLWFVTRLLAHAIPSALVLHRQGTGGNEKKMVLSILKNFIQYDFGASR
jgi:hypothetical protein